MSQLYVRRHMPYPEVLDSSKVGTYPAQAKAGGGLVWDAVLEYRVWCHPDRGAPDLAEGGDYYYPFETGAEAEAFSKANPGTEEALALVLQREYIDEPEPGHYVHVLQERIVEWPVVFLARPRRDQLTIPEFFALDAPTNRLDILRGLAPRTSRDA
jgi:putative acetyltransferase